MIDQANDMDISPITHGPPVASDSNILIARTHVHEAVSPSDRIQLSSEAARELMTAKIESIATGKVDATTYLHTCWYALFQYHMDCKHVFQNIKYHLFPWTQVTIAFWIHNFNNKLNILSSFK